MNILQLLYHLNQLQVEIHLVEDRLKISYPGNCLTPELVDTIKKNKKGIIDFLQKNQETFSPIEPVEKKEYYPSSSNQKRLYILQEIADDSTVYNLPNSIVLGGFEAERFNRSLKELLKRHEIMRTSFRLISDRLVQIVHPHVDVKVEYFSKDEGNWQEKSEKENIDKILRDFIRPFDLSKAPLLRAALIKLEEKCVVMFDLHHIISDGVSLDMMIEEFMVLYAGDKPAELRIHYKDYSEWRSGKKQVESVKKQEQFWLHGFSGEIPVLNLPYDYPRPVMQSFEGNTITFQIEARETGLLKQMARTRDVTMYMLLLGFFYILLAKLSRQEDIIIGTPTAGRRHADMEKIMGLFLNTLAMRNFPLGEKLFTDFLKEVKANVLTAFENQDYQYEELLEKTNVARDTGRNPLFDAMFILQNVNIPEVKFSKLDVKLLQYESVVSKFDLTLTAVEYPGAIWMDMEYCMKLFKSSTIHRFIGYFKQIISTVLSGGDMRISDIEIITDEEKRHMIDRFNDTRIEYIKDKTIYELFFEQSAKTPDFTAVKFTDRQLTYRELNDRAGQWAGILRSRGIDRGAIAGLALNRSLELVLGILGILKAGGAYLPIDPGHPAERLVLMMRDSAASAVLTRRSTAQAAGWLNSLNVDVIFAEEIEASPDETNNSSELQSSADAAYIIYTSGSAGLPKGVMITHGAVVNFIKGITDVIPFTPRDSILSLTTVSFDIFVLESLLPLTRGAGVVVGSETEQLNPLAASSLMGKEKITIFQVTPSRLHLIISGGQPAGSLGILKYLLIGGENLPVSLLRSARKLTKGKIYNLYGPTETTVWSTMKDVSTGKVDIGKPIANTGIFILDKSGCFQPPGVSGDVYIEGDGLARGYINSPELTAEKFITNPGQFVFRNGDPLTGSCTSPIIYRTDDLGRWLPDGNIEFLGRADHQVKIRGFRIEIGEIEELLRKHDWVKEAVVVVCEDKKGVQNLCAYIVSEPGIEVKELRSYLSKILPDYMVPSCFVRLDMIPLTPNGKVNRRLLPEWEFSTDREYAGPGNEIEKKLVQIWAEVLEIGKEKIGIHDNFFDRGGHSFKATILTMRILKLFNVQVTLREMYKAPTIRELSTLINMALYPNKEALENNDERKKILI